MEKSLGGCLSANDLSFAQIHKIIGEEYRFLHFYFSLSASNVLFNCSGSYCVVKKFSLSNCTCFTGNLCRSLFEGCQCCLFFLITFFKNRFRLTENFQR